MILDYCFHCAEPELVEVTTPNSTITWGNPDSRYGEHKFVIIDRYWECRTCGHKSYTSEQLDFQARQINELVKAKLGIDWLAENVARRKARRDGNSPPDMAYCQSSRDGDCDWTWCPQIRDGEPKTTGRHCPLDVWKDGELVKVQYPKKCT